MATIEHWNKYMAVVHDLALVENDLRAVRDDATLYDGWKVADTILHNRF
jgi:hypothetical protein